MQKVNPSMPRVLSKEGQMKYVVGELQGLRQIISFLWDGNQEAFNILLFIKSNYKEWPAMIRWMKANKLVGQKLVDMFKNESPDGGGYHMGAMFILSRLKGFKHEVVGVKIDELL